MPLDRKPTKAATPWVPDLLFDPVAPPRAPAAPTSTPAPEAKPAELVTTEAAAPESAPQLPERPAPQAPAISDSPAILDSNDPIELRRILAEQEKALLKVRIHRRNLQEDLAKARRTFMFAERTRLYSAKGALDALTAQEQQTEIEERRLASDILAIRSKLDRVAR
jgi:hypothetical protein